MPNCDKCSQPLTITDAAGGPAYFSFSGYKIHISRIATDVYTPADAKLCQPCIGLIAERGKRLPT